LQRDIAEEAFYQSEAGYSYYNNVESPEPLKVRIDLSEQTAYFSKGDAQVGRARVATGKPGHSTPTGSFSITEKIADKRSNLYGRIYDANGAVVISDADTREDSVPSGGKYVGAAMPNWMRLTSYGVGMHAGPIPRPGQPVSHGCIRMPKNMATLLFADSRIGTPVTIVE
jgi:lipoprotein-anchoring transpeptidase ErfK/SrfK